jgi:hypothetical protein
LTSAAKIAANRRNAARSSGPRSEAGKSRTRRNAFRHGLAIPIGTNDAFGKQIDMLAQKLAATSGTAPDTAADVAEAWFELLRARQVETETISRALAVAELQHQAQLAIAVRNVLWHLVAIQRYKGRAWSRLKKLTRPLEQTTTSQFLFDIPTDEFEKQLKRTSD